MVKIVKNLGNGRLNNLNDPVRNVLILLTVTAVMNIVTFLFTGRIKMVSCSGPCQ